MCPRDVPKGEEKAAKQRIVEAAIELFARKGFSDAPVREIADMAGVTKPTVYYYFGSKEGLGIAIERRAHEEMDRHVFTAVRETKGVFEGLVAFVYAHFVACIEHEYLVRFAYAVNFGPMEPEAAVNFKQVHEESRGVALGILEEGVRQDLIRADRVIEAGKMIMGMVNVTMIMYLMERVTVTREDIERMVRVLMEGIGTRQAGVRGV